MSIGEAANPVVRIDAGSIEGRFDAERGVEIFKGIPFAKAPVGELRWQPPRPAEPWAHVRSATEAGPACPQTITPPEAFYTFDQPQVSEDCLYLNVWAPRGGRNLPVMLWIHGGALIWGAGSDPWYDGALLANEDVIVVTFNYRLGVLGYFSHPELSAESLHGASGNYGTLDQIAALQWVKRNIAAFGGDPDRVMLFGESAGALSITHLMASPLATGLFHGALAQSVYLPAMPELRAARFGPSAEDAGLAFGQAHGAPTLADLRAMPVDALIDAASTSYGNVGGAMAVVDGWVQHQQVFETFAQGLQAKVPFIAGYNSGEQRALDPGTLPPFPADPVDFETRVRAAYGDLADEFLRLYPPHMVTDSSYDAVRDAYYGWAVERLLRDHRAVTPDAWMYYFDHVYAAADARGLGAFHASDIFFTFGLIGPDTQVPPNWPAPAAEAGDARMARMMMGCFASFARHGNPASESSPAWPAFDADRGSCLVFREGDAIATGRPMPGMFELHDAHFARLMKAGVPWTWVNMGTAATPLPEPV
jgi:para-nitrobenzyl esterase